MIIFSLLKRLNILFIIEIISLIMQAFLEAIISLGVFNK